MTNQINQETQIEAIEAELAELQRKHDEYWDADDLSACSKLNNEMIPIRERLQQLKARSSLTRILSEQKDASQMDALKAVLEAAGYKPKVWYGDNVARIYIDNCDYKEKQYISWPKSRGPWKTDLSDIETLMDGAEVRYLNKKGRDWSRDLVAKLREETGVYENLKDLGI